MNLSPQRLLNFSLSLGSRLLSPASPTSHVGTKAHAQTEKKHVSSDVRSAIHGTTKLLFSLQKSQGFWEAPVYDNVTITAEYVMTLTFLNLLDESTQIKCRQSILDQQLPDGGWNLYNGGPSDHSATVEAYFALKLCDQDENSTPMILARKKALEGGGIETTRVFTKIHLALFGQHPWSKIPVISPELMLMPTQSPINIYEFSSWSRAVIVPLLIIFDKKPIHKLHPKKRIEELIIKDLSSSKRKDTFEQFFELSQRLLAVYEKVPIKPFRKKALDLAENWILDHQDEQGNWGGIYPAMANSIVALHLRGYALTHERLKKGLKMLKTFAQDDGQSFRMQSTVSPVWDTGIAAYAMLESGLDPANERLQKSLSWLMGKQILNIKGDWKYKAPKVRPGGWPFEHENDLYPDIDDSALAILALLPRENDQEQKHESHAKVTKSIDRGIEWILGMQGTDGGWGAFDKDNNREILNQIPFADLKSLLDPSTPDVTGHVLEALGAAGFSISSKPIAKALAFLKKTQEKNGAWFGRWGVNYIYGTSAVLSALHVLKENTNQAYVTKAIDWLESVQNKDGGFGESCASYDHHCYVPLGYSTASQTAWGLLGLLSSPKASDKSIEKAARYLLDTQRVDGSWSEPEFTGTGFPRHFYLRYDYYRLYFPLLALGRYQKWKTR